MFVFLNSSYVTHLVMELSSTHYLLFGSIGLFTSLSVRLPVCLSVCLSVNKQHYSYNDERDATKLYGEARGAIIVEAGLKVIAFHQGPTYSKIFCQAQTWLTKTELED